MLVDYDTFSHSWLALPEGLIGIKLFTPAIPI